MIKALIIDDESLARNILKAYLRDYPQIQLAAECANGFEGMKAIQEHQPDLLFLDIQMPKINGFEMLELIENPPAVIFTTAFDEYAIKAFEASATDYLLKPFSKERFEKAVTKFLENQKPAYTIPLDSISENSLQHNRIVVKDGSKIKIIPVADTHYLEAADDYVKIHTPEGVFLKKRTLAFYEKILESQQFVRIHRSYLINTALVTRIDAYEKEGHVVRLSTGAILPVSKTGFPKLKAALGI